MATWTIFAIAIAIVFVIVLVMMRRSHGSR
jgi:preprotein translocase subunit SecG